MSDLQLGIRISADGKIANAEITKVSTGLSNMGTAGDRAANQLNSGFSKTRRGVQSISEQLSLLHRQFSDLSALYVGKEMLTGVLQTADAFTNLNSRLKSATGTQQELARAMTDVSSIANQYRLDINEVGGAYARFASSAQKLGMSQADLGGLLATVSAGLQLSGSSSSQAAGSMQQLGQALASPIIHAEELNSVFEGNLVLYNAIEKQLPDLVARYGSLKNAVNEQALTNQDLAKAILGASSSLTQQAQVMQTTVSGAVRVLSNEWEKYVGQTDQASGSSAALANSILLLSKNLDTIMAVPAKMAEGWSLIFDAIGKATNQLQSFATLAERTSVSDALLALVSPTSGGGTPTREQQMAQLGVNPAITRPANSGQPAFTGQRPTSSTPPPPDTKALKEANAVLTEQIRARIDAEQRGFERFNAEQATKLKAIDLEISRVKEEAQQQINATQDFSQAQAIAAQLSDTLRGKLEAEFAIKDQLLGVQQSVQQATIEAYQQQISKAKDLGQSESDRLSIQRAIAEATGNIDRLTESRNQLNMEYADKVRKSNEDMLDGKRKEQDFIRKINADLAFQQTLYEKLNAAKQSGADASALELMKQQTEAARNLPQSVGADQVAALQAKINKTQELSQANDAMAGSSKKVADEQLRANQAWEESLQRMQDYMAGLGDSMGETGKAFAKVAVSMGRYEKQQKQIWRDLDQANKDNPQEESLNTAHAYLEVGMSSLTMMADMADAAKTMYEEGSSGYQSMADAAFAMRSAVMALNIVDGIAAILKQLKEGDPYSAIPRAIAVAGMVAALGVSVAAHAGTGNTQGYAEKAGKNDTGTVFGDSSAQSESLTNALKLVAANSTADLSYSAGMLRSLQNIEYAMAGATRSVLMNVKPSSFSQPGPVAGNGMIAFGMDPFSIALTNMLMKRTREVTDYGLASNPQALGDVLSGGYQGKIYTDIKTQTKLLGMTISESMKTVFKALDDATANDFTRIIVNLKDTLVEAGRALGASADDFTSRMAGFTVDLGAQSLKGLKGEELQKQLQAMFSALSDRMAQAFMPGLDDFQKVGEGYFETMVRVSHGINTASGMLAQLGLEATKYTDIVWKQGDVAAEIVRQSIVQAEGAATAIGRYMDTAVGSADDLIAIYQDLLAIKDMAPTLAFNLDALTQTMVVTAGGVSRLKEAMASYLTGFFSQSEQMGVTYAALQRQFGSLGTTVPGSRKAFRDLVSGLDLTTESGQKLYARLMALADPLASFMDQLDQARQAFLEGFGTQTDQIQAQYKALKAEFNALGKAIPVSREAFRDLVNGITGTTEAGRLLRGQLMSLSAGLAEYFSRIEQIQARYAPLTNPFAELETNLKTVNDDFALLLQSTQDGQTQSRKQIDKLSRQIQGNLTKIDDLETALAKEEAKRKPNQTRLDRIRDSLIDRQTAILAWQAEIDRLTAQSANEIDSVLEEQGLALVATLKSGWESIVGSLNAARDSVASQLADLNGPQAKLDLSITREAEAQARLAMAGTNPAEVAKLVGGVQEAIMARYNAELALINETATKAQQAYNTQLQAIKQIKDYAKGLLLSGNSTLSPEARLTTARGQYEALLQQSQTGNADALGQLTSAADAYLQAAQGYFASGPEYQALFGQIYEALDTLGSTTLIDPVDTQTAAIEALKAETVAKLTDLQAVTAAAMASAQDQMGTFIKDFESWMVANHVDSVALLDAVSGLRQTVFGTSAGGIRIPDPTIDALMPNDMGPIPITFTPPNAPLAVQTTGSPLSTSDAEVTSLLTSIQQEAKAQVAVQTAAFPSMIERLTAVEATLSKLERTARLAA